jgi:hypothetical protein
MSKPLVKINFNGYGKKSQNIIDTIDKLKKNKITMEEILNQDDLIIELNLLSNSVLSAM